MIKISPKLLQAKNFKKEHMPYLMAFALVMTMYLPKAFAANTIEGTIFKDLNRNSIQDPGEDPIAGLQVGVIDRGLNKYIAQAITDANGRYVISERSISAGGGGITDGNYLVYITSGSPGWWDYDDEWVPTDTSTSTWPKSDINLSGSAQVNFPIRPIVKSLDSAHPISSYTGSNGLRTRSYNDVFEAKEVYDSIMRGGYVGEEAKAVTMSVAEPGTASITSTGYSGTQGSYTDVSSSGNCTYESARANSSLFEGKINDRCFNHEYGHAWSFYYGIEYHQDRNFSSYQQARGILGDSRINSSYAWQVTELIAEDYRQLLGSSASQDGQTNWELPLARDVAGLKDFLINAFRTRSAPPPPTADIEPPSAPANLRQTGQTLNSILFAWDAAADNVGTTAYEVFRDGIYVNAVSSTSFTDTNLSEGTTYNYTVVAMDAAGNVSAPSQILVASTARLSPPPAPDTIISNLSISPNPVLLSGKTNPVIKYSLSESSSVSVNIMDSGGAVVRQIISNVQQSGGQQISWDRKNNSGRKIRSGNYSVKVQARGSNGVMVTQTLNFMAK